MTTSRLLPRPGRAAVLLTALGLLVLEEVALGLAEEEDRPVIGGALIGVSCSGLLVVGAVLFSRWLDARLAIWRTAAGHGSPRPAALG